MCVAFLVAQTVKNSPAMWEPGFELWVGNIPWRRTWQPTPVLLPEKSHGQRSLASYSPWGCKRVGHDLATKLRTTVTRTRLPPTRYAIIVMYMYVL